MLEEEKLLLEERVKELILQLDVAQDKSRVSQKYDSQCFVNRLWYL